uniref:Uncharacterized protein n=1 Tax=Chenopodium quinoa TaxID=63459 RepID=A0A803MX59_CHEQI
MAPSRRKGASKAAAAAAARRQWKVGDLVLAKVKGFPAWPATVSEPEKWGYSCDWKKVLVYFFGTKQIAFCNPADVEEFTEEKKEFLLGKRQGRGADFVRAVQEIVDCYEKLKENNQNDRLSSGGASAENAVTDDLNASNARVPDATHNSTVKSPNSCRPKDEPGTALEDVGALTEVESTQQTVLSEEQDNNAAGPNFSMPNTYTLRKKSRSSQPQRSANKKKVSVQRSRSSLRFHSRGLQNGELKCCDSNLLDDVGLNGFLDGPLRRAKRSKRSPDLNVPSVEDSPICNSNGTVEDNGSEIAMADSENLSNNDGSAIESDHKREQLDFFSEGFERGLELSRRLDFHAKTVVVRKKRNPGRKRIQNDVIEFTSRSDHEVSNELQVLKDTMALPSLCGKLIENHHKDESDEHLPLVKRARVRMGKMPAEEHQQLDFLVKGEEKSLGFVPVSACKLASTSLNCDDSHQPTSTSLNCEDIHPPTSTSMSVDNISPPKDLLTVNELIVSSPVDNVVEVAEDKPQTQKEIDSCVVNESVAFSPVNNCIHIPEDKPQPLKTKINHPFGCVFDGEAALPPSKRLHRALEAMSANAAEESQTPVLVSLSTKVETEVSHFPLAETNSDMHLSNEGDNDLESHHDSLNCNNAFHDDCAGLSNISEPTNYEVITKSFQDVSMLDSPDRILDTEKAESKDNSEEVTVCVENKDLRGTEITIVPDNILPDQASQPFLSSVPESGLSESLTTVLTQPHLEVLSKAGEEEMVESGTECYKPADKMQSGKDINSELGEDKVTNVGCSNGTTVGLCNGKAGNFATNENLKVVMTKLTEAVSLCETVNKGESTADVRMDASSSPPFNASQQICHDAVSGVLSNDLDDDSKTTIALPAEVEKQKHVSHSNNLIAASDNSYHSLRREGEAIDAKLPLGKLAADAAESKVLDADMCLQVKSGERTNLAEVKAALASLELTLGSLTRTKESIGRATRIAVDCVKFGSAVEVVDLLALYLEKESSLYRRVDLFFLVDSIAQCSRGLKGEVGGTYISAVKENLARMLSAAAPPGQAGRENRRQCLKASVLRLWLERRILPESIICQHIRELDSLNCSSSTGGYSRRMSRTERSFDDPLRDMEGMLVDEYGSNSSFQLPGFCMPRMLKEEDDGSDSDGGSFEAVTPEHDFKDQEPQEKTPAAATVKHRHILEDVDGELEMEDNMQEAMSARPPVSGMHHPMQMPTSTSCSYNSCPVMHNHVAPGNNLQPMDGNLYGKAYNVRPPYPSSSNQFSYLLPDQQVRPQREVAPPPYYDRSRFAQSVDGGQFYGDHDVRQPRHELTDSWGYSRPPYPSPCEPMRPPNHGWGFPPRPMHHGNHMSGGPPCDGSIPVAARGLLFQLLAIGDQDEHCSIANWQRLPIYAQV